MAAKGRALVALAQHRVVPGMAHFSHAVPQPCAQCKHFEPSDAARRQLASARDAPYVFNGTKAAAVGACALYRKIKGGWRDPPSFDGMTKGCKFFDQAPPRWHVKDNEEGTEP